MTFRPASKRRQCVGPAVRPGLRNMICSSAEGAAQEACGRFKHRDLFTASSLTLGYCLLAPLGRQRDLRLTSCHS
jgi:hypothetical protein